MLSMLAVMTALTVQAQIGYKGQVTAAIDGGITHLGGFVGSARIGAYLSPHSVLGGGVMFDKTRYDATLDVYKRQEQIPLALRNTRRASPSMTGNASCR